ncbi:hypothetical protein DEO23_03130 [Brachybacterium endophyticum]|uniref:LytR/CpsA/Psr regulator C-terminal domain-containing protein n=1 Tax=Brachybacterium endophyticum TaxID=2182385 RepID=A0A2U2RP42_9MICO|nr:LytR C-terminal domain-containing protein [Brachybacterium endophyticum]PWH07630.1 hypothetical protein DEO23_03130 [Brachybacterium endophyticum]
MADSEYPYPPDQYDEEAADVAFHGAHRAEESFWRQNLVYLIIIAVAVVILLALLFTIGGLGRSGDERADSPTTSASQDDSSKQASDGGGDEEDKPKADASTPILVLNGGNVSGMAADWKQALTDDGWSNVGIGTSDNVQQESVVFYRDKDDEASAQELADQVGAEDARQSDEYDNRITFVAVQPPEND